MLTAKGGKGTVGAKAQTWASTGRLVVTVTLVQCDYLQDRAEGERGKDAADQVGNKLGRTSNVF